MERPVIGPAHQKYRTYVLTPIASRRSAKGGRVFSKSDLTQYLDDYSSPNKDAKRGSSNPRGKNGAELCSSGYRDKIKDAIFGSSQSSQSFSSAIEDDVKKMTSSIYDDLKDSLDSIYRVSESHKKSMIDAMQIFREIVSGSRAVEVIRILDYTAELILPLPEQTMFSREKPSLKPITFTSKELLRGHQDFEEYLKRKGNDQFRYKARYITAEYVEKYSHELSKYIKAALLLDTDNEMIYIGLYVDGMAVLRTEYTDITYKWYLKEGKERLSVNLLRCKAFSDGEVASANRENWNDNMNIAGMTIEGAGALQGIYTAHPIGRAIAAAAQYLPPLGQALQAASLSFKLSRDKLESGDFEFYYGNSDKGYGGVFCGKSFSKKE